MLAKTGENAYKLMLSRRAVRICICHVVTVMQMGAKFPETYKDDCRIIIMEKLYFLHFSDFSEKYVHFDKI